jgi:hypothetical protein
MQMSQVDGSKYWQVHLLKKRSWQGGVWHIHLEHSYWLLRLTRQQVHFYFDCSKNCLSVALTQSTSRCKTSIGSLFEVDPNYLVQTELHSIFVNKKALASGCVGRRGPGLLSSPWLLLLFWKTFCCLAEDQRGKTRKNQACISLYFITDHWLRSLFYMEPTKQRPGGGWDGRNGKKKRTK